MTVLVLVCALTVAAPDCDKSTAIHIFYAPDAQYSLVGCLREGTMYAAQSGLITPGTYSKVYCGPQRRPAARSTRNAE
jgi:hypothetical protein